MGIWAWAAIWTTLVVGSLICFALIARRLFHSMLALAEEGAELGRRMDELSQLADELQRAADEMAARRTAFVPAPYRNLVEVQRAYETRKKENARRKSRRAAAAQPARTDPRGRFT